MCFLRPGAPPLRASGWKQRYVLLCDKRNNMLKSHGYLSCVQDCTGSTTTMMNPPSTAGLRAAARLAVAI